MTAKPDLDFLIVGAGISGIGIASNIKRRFPEKSFELLEARQELGGTWSLFRYPGLRSDSDLHTLGYSFRPWLEEQAIADGDSILRYISDTAAETGVDEHIRFGQKVTNAAWNSEDHVWTAEVADVDSGERRIRTARWLVAATGYYSYDRGHSPSFPGADLFRGPVIHPQHWPEDLDWENKRVVVIGSGATAITLVPALAEKAEHVTMLQRTPSYVVSVPAVDPLGARIKRWFGPERGHRIVREKNIWIARTFYKLSQRFPGLVRRLIRSWNIKALPAGFDVDRHFNPPYGPWDQRMCLVPDGDLFRVLSDGSASVVTDQIDTFTETGVRLSSGKAIPADIVVTATGLELLAFGGMELTIDGARVSLPDTYTYKSMMLTGVPNFSYLFGYTNASWTLRVDLICDRLCRLIELMDERGLEVCVPDEPDARSPQPLIDLDAGYILRSQHKLPKQGSMDPWRLGMDYVKDRRSMRRGPFTEGLRFQSVPAPFRAQR